MSDQTPLGSPELHRNIAAKCNDMAWGYVEKANLQATEIAQLLTLAATARHHWHVIGQPGNIAHADLLFAWSLARAGISDASVLMAREALAYFQQNGAMWERAFAHAAMAAACCASHDASGLQEHASKAAELGAKLSGQDATYFQAAFMTIPKEPRAF